MSASLIRSIGAYSDSVRRIVLTLIILSSLELASLVSASEKPLVLYVTDAFAYNGRARDRGAPGPGPEVLLKTRDDQVLFKVDQKVLRAHLERQPIAEATLTVPLTRPLPQNFVIGSIQLRRTEGTDGSTRRGSRGVPARYRDASTRSALVFDVTGDVQGFVSGEIENSGWFLELVAFPVRASQVAMGSAFAPVRQAPTLGIRYRTNPKEPVDAVRVAHPAGSPAFLRFRTKRGYFLPFGVNYDHDHERNLIETYWHTDWRRVVGDFQEMEDMGFNLVRIHLQLHEFLTGPAATSEDNLLQLDRLVQLASRHGIYLNITGLGMYARDKIPRWFRELGDEARMDAEAFFWREIAVRYRRSPSIFCYNLQNEPKIAPRDTDEIVEGTVGGFSYHTLHFRQLSRWWARWVHEKYPTEKNLRRAWRQFPEGGETYDAPRLPAANQARRWKDYVQFRDDLAFFWTRRMADAIRAVDPNHMVTVGMFRQPHFAPGNLAPLLDFISVHLYPEASATDPNGLILDYLVSASEFERPLVIEEFWPSAGVDNGAIDFLHDSVDYVSGWTSFYWGSDIEQLWQSSRMRDRIAAYWYESFTLFGSDLREMAGLTS